MNDLDGWISKENLLEAAFAAGFKVSQDQLVRWYRAGLLPRPKQIHLGRHGSQIIFPKSAINQLIEICRIHKTEKRLEYIAWRLWWNGIDVDFEAVRNFLRSITEEWDKCRNKYFFLGSDAVEIEISASKDARFKDKIIRGARKRIGRQKFSQIVRTLLEVISGKYSKKVEQAEADQIDLEKAFGIERAREQGLGTIRPWLKGEDLNKAAEFFGKLNFSVVAAETSGEELIQARDELQPLFVSLKAVSPVLDKVFGKSAFGFSSINNLIQRTTPPAQALLLLFWQAYRKTGDTKQKAQILADIQNNALVIAHYERAFELIIAEVTGSAQLLSPKRRREAMRSQRAKEKHLAEAKEFYIDHQEEFDEFWRRHPEFLNPKND